MFHGIHGFQVHDHGSEPFFLRISWIWGGFSMEFMDFRWISMDPDWIFYGFLRSGVDFPWNSWISNGFPWIPTGFSMDFMDLGWINFMDLLMEFCLRPKRCINLALFFYEFHGSGVDVSWNSWISGT